MTRATLSAVLITQNAASVLADCLASIDWVDEIIVLDSGSQDDSCQIAKKAGATVYQDSHWLGFGQQRQRAQRYARCDYILMLDSDERVSPTLRHAIEQQLQQPQQTDTVYRMTRSNYFLGRFMRHSGWYPDYVIRLYPREHYQYDDAKVHESLACKGAKVVTLPGHLTHLTCQDLIQFQQKQLRYAQAWAQQRYQQGKRCSFISIYLRTLAAFMKTLFIRAGLLDGKQGWLLAVVNAQYTFNKYATLWSLTTMENHR